MSTSDLIPVLAPAVGVLGVLATGWIFTYQRREHREERAADRGRADALRRAERGLPLLEQAVAQLDVLTGIEERLRPGRHNTRGLEALRIGPEIDELCRRLDALPVIDGWVGGLLRRSGPIQDARTALVRARSVPAVPDDDAVAAARNGPSGSGLPDPLWELMLDLVRANAEQRQVADEMKASIAVLREAVISDLKRVQAVIDGLTGA